MLYKMQDKGLSHNYLIKDYKIKNIWQISKNKLKRIESSKKIKREWRDSKCKRLNVY